MTLTEKSSMARSRRSLPSILLGIAVAAMSVPVAATEGGAGHYIVGAYATPGAGIVPPQPGLYWSDSNLYYGASASSTHQIPVAGNIVSGLRADFSSFALSAIYVPRVDLGQFTIAAGVTLPGQYMDVEGTLGSRSRSDTSGGLGDMIITPAIVGWHAGGDFLQTRLDIFAPTAGYNLGSLANIGMGYWTFTPTVAYTHIVPEIGLDISANLGIDFNTRNEKTGYQSGTLLHFDTAVTKSIGTTGVGLGLLGSILYQISDDTGVLASRLDGFQGRSFAVGPVVRYAFEVGKVAINSSLRWAPEFAVQNRISGNAVYLNFAGSF